jgi:DNA-binding NtrC family response regulator
MKEDPRVRFEGQFQFYDEVRRFEMNLIERALIQANGKQRPAARLLGMKASTLHAKIKLYNITISRFSRDLGREPGVSLERLDADACKES